MEIGIIYYILTQPQDYQISASCNSQNVEISFKGGETMSLDAMKKVAEAESAAKQSMQAASVASKQLIADAEAKGRACYDAKMAQAQAEVKQLMLDAEAQAAKNAEETLHHAKNQCAVLRAHAEGRLDEASSRIVERIVMG